MKLVLEYAILSVRDVKMARITCDGDKYTLTVEYIDEWGEVKEFKATGSNLSQLGGYLTKVKEILPHLKTQEINRAIMSE